jgi:para-aminobenzoate synthetase component I
MTPAGRFHTKSYAGHLPAPEVVGAIVRGVAREIGAMDSRVDNVQRVIDLILTGDVFQASIAQRFSATLGTPFDPLQLYRRLRALNPAPFAAFLRYGDLIIASSSPERFLKLDSRSVETRPIKGTIARSGNVHEDRRRTEYLLSSRKDRAENIMIVDLLRNDL